MIRLMGILTGSAIAVGLLVIALGMPEFAAEPAAPAPPTNPASAMPTATPPTVAEAPPIEPEPAAAPPVDEAAPVDALEAIPGPTPVSANAATESPVRIEEPPPADETGWFAFWSPFRSEIAAAGFVSELQRTTGIDYRVVKLKPGVYEVAFAYSDENDIQDKLTRISTATGLDLSGG